MKYQADKEGNIFNDKGHQMKFWINPSGYYYFKMYHGNNKKQSIAVHRFVYEYFKGEIPSPLCIDHINTDKLDNRLENLRVTTNAFNCRRREYNKLDIDKAAKIREEYSSTRKSMDKLAIEFGVSKTTIFNVVRKNTWYND